MKCESTGKSSDHIETTEDNVSSVIETKQVFHLNPRFLNIELP
jgi:hypothetical protein